MENLINEKIEKLNREIQLAELNLKSNLDNIEVSDIYASLTSITPTIQTHPLALSSSKQKTMLDTVLNNRDLLTKAFKVYQIFS